MKFVFALTFLVSLSAFAQVKTMDSAPVETTGGYGTGGEKGVGVPGGIAGGYPGGAVGGYVGGGMNGGYPANSLWNCQLSHDEKEINCASGKKYKLAIDGDESERSNIYIQKWVPNFLEVEKQKKSNQE